MIKNKHIDVSKLIATSKPGTELINAIYEAIATACDNQIDVSLHHNDVIYEVNRYDLFKIVNKTGTPK